MLENEEWMNQQSWLEWIEPKGGIVCAPRLRKGGSTRELCELIVRKYRTFVVPGYYLKLDEYSCLGYGGDRANLVAGLEMLKKALVLSSFLFLLNQNALSAIPSSSLFTG